MSDAVKEVPGMTPAEAAHEFQVDWFFRQLVENAHLGIEIGVTLTVGGSTISGLLVSGKTYFEHTAKVLSEATTGPLSQVFAKFSEFGQMYEIDPETARLRYDRTTYLHLKEARIFHPGANETLPPANLPGVWWRGKLSSVDGFFISFMQPSAQ